MPVTGATTRNDYVAGDGQTVFAYTFQILLDSDIKVIKNGATLTLSNDYTVSNAGVAGGGNVTLTAGAALNDAVSILLAMPIDRTTEYQNAGDFLASDVNGDFDKGYVAMNQLQTSIARALGLKDIDPSVDMTLPLLADRANKYLMFNSQGIPTVAPATNDSYTINVKDHGARGNGTTDDRVAIQSAINYAESQSITPHGTPIVVFPSGRYRIGSPGDSTGLVIKRANVQGSGPFGCTLVWGGDVNGTCIQWEAKFPKFFGGFRFAATNKTVNDPKIWFDAAYVSDPSITGKLDYGDDFFDLFFEQTSNVADACHMNLPKIINCYARRLRFQAAPHLIRIAQSHTASANRVFALKDWTTDFNQLPADGVKSLFKVDMQGAASLTLALSNARVETRHNSMGSPKAIVEVHNSQQGSFDPGSQSFTSTEGQVNYVINTAPSQVQFGDQITITDDGVAVNRKQYSFDVDTKTVTLLSAPATGSAIVINWAPFNMPVNGISVDLRDMGFQLTKDTSDTDDSQISQGAVLLHHTTDQTNVTSDIQMQNVYLDGFSSLYGGNWSTSYSTPDPSDLTNARIKFWSTGRMLEKTSQQLGDYVKIADAATLHREAANSMSLKGADGTDIDFAVTGTIAVDTCKWHCGSGSPEGAVIATVGSMFTRTDGGSNTTLYIKESGTGNTGWVAK